MTQENISEFLIVQCNVFNMDYIREICSILFLECASTAAKRYLDNIQWIYIQVPMQVSEHTSRITAFYHIAHYADVSEKHHSKL